ncbi:MAG: hypothetical protein M1814_003587 [Vezdaea aestivalis]|nr:MAG: hypothetical protein M1814_003587 [Vezdaea aestivalis]
MPPNINRSDYPNQVKKKLNRDFSTADWDRWLRLSFEGISSFRDAKITSGTIDRALLWKDFWHNSDLVREALSVLREEPELAEIIRTAQVGLDSWLLGYAYKALVKKDSAKKMKSDGEIPWVVSPVQASKELGDEGYGSPDMSQGHMSPTTGRGFTAPSIGQGYESQSMVPGFPAPSIQSVPSPQTYERQVTDIWYVIN